MAPGLFLRLTDKILDDTVSQGSLGINIGTECFNDLDYADDVALLAESCGDVVDSLETMGQEALRFGLEINWAKNQDPANRCSGHDSRSCSVACNQVELVRGFCYLFSHVEADGAAVRRYVGVAIPNVLL